MATTLRVVMDAVLQRLSMADGVDAQLYAEDRIRMAIQHKFDDIFREYWLPQFTTIQELYTLDGTTGMITGDLSTRIIDWEDLHSVFLDGYDTPIPLAPMNILDGNIASPMLRMNATNAAKLFKIVPVTTTGDVRITYRTKPDDFEDDADVINMDKQLLILGTCWDVLEDDGTNPGGADKFKSLYARRVGQLQKSQFNIPSSMYPAGRGVWNRWG